MATEEDVEVSVASLAEGEDVIEEPVQVKMYQVETIVSGDQSLQSETGKETGGGGEEEGRRTGLIQIPIASSNGPSDEIEIEAEEVHRGAAGEQIGAGEDRTDQQVTDIAEDQITGLSGRPKTSTQASLDDVVEIPVEYEEALTEPLSISESSKPLSEAFEAPPPPAEGGGLIEVAVVQLGAEEHVESKAEETGGGGLVEIPVEVVSEEHSVPEPSAPTQPEPASRKTSSKQPPSKTPSLDKSEKSEAALPPGSPTKKISTASKIGAMKSKTPSVEELEKTPASPVKKKSSAAFKEVPVEVQEAQKTPSPAKSKTPSVDKSEASSEKAAPVPESPVKKKSSAAFKEVPVEQEASPPVAKPREGIKSKTPSVDKSEASLSEKVSTPASPVKKKSSGAFKEIPIETSSKSKTPSVSEESPVTPASPVKKKSSTTAAYKEVAIEQDVSSKEDLPPVKKKSSITAPSEPPAEFREVKIEQEPPPPPIPEEQPKSEAKRPSRGMLEIPISVEGKEEAPAPPPLIDIPVSAPREEVTFSPSPSPSRRAKEPIEPYVQAQLDQQEQKVKLPPRSSSYVTYASWAPPEINQPPYVPHSAFVQRASKYRNEHTAGYKYTPPALTYLNEFDDLVKVGSFSKSLWAEDRAFRRSRSLDRRRPMGGYATSQFGPPPLRRSGSTSVPTSMAPSRSTSFTNLMDYVVATNNDLRRSRSRSRLQAEADYQLSRMPSRSHVVSSELLNYYEPEPDPFERQAFTTYNYVRRLHEPYESTVDSYYGRYVGRPYGPFAGAMHYDHLYPRDDYSQRRIQKRYIPDHLVSPDNALFAGRNLRDQVHSLERRYRAYPQYPVHDQHGWKPRQYFYPFP